MKKVKSVQKRGENLPLHPTAMPCRSTPKSSKTPNQCTVEVGLLMANAYNSRVPKLAPQEPKSDGLQPTCAGPPTYFASNLLAVASNLLAVASNLLAISSNLLAMASNLLAMASNLLAVASNLLAMASNLLAVASNRWPPTYLRWPPTYLRWPPTY